jgi:hypothetical protein
VNAYIFLIRLISVICVLFDYIGRYKQGDILRVQVIASPFVSRCFRHAMVSC